VKHWLRIHLTTALVLMLVASGLLWLNLSPDERSLPKLKTVQTQGGPMVEYEFSRRTICYGFPWHCYYQPQTLFGAEWESNPEESYTYIQPVVLNCIFALLSLFVLSRAMEFLLRRIALARAPSDSAASR